MGILNKIMFWKKEEDDFGFDELAQDDLGLSQESEQQRLGLDEKPLFPEEKSALPTHLEEPGTPTPPAHLAPSGGGGKDLELINSKLDTLKAILTSLEQKMSNLERAAGVEEKKQRLW